MACKYCSGEHESLYKINTVDVFIEHWINGNPKYTLCVEANLDGYEVFENINLNYCPRCGRNLKNEE